MTHMFTTGGNRSYYDLNNYAPKTKQYLHCKDGEYIGTCNRCTNRIPRQDDIPFDKRAFMQFLADIRNS